MKVLLIVFVSVIFFVWIVLVYVVDIINGDKKLVVIDVVENGMCFKLLLLFGVFESICFLGCFIIVLNGDCVGLSGGEIVKIIGGVVIVN